MGTVDHTQAVQASDFPEPAFGDTAEVGYDPYRKHRTTRIDCVLVAAATIVAVGLVLWALVG